MKTTILKYTGLSMIIMFCAIISLTAQARYKHIPRVRIEKKNVTPIPVDNKKTNELIPVTENKEEAENINPASTEVANVEETPILNTERKSIKLNNEVIDKKHAINKNRFSEQVKKKSKLMDVKEVEKAQLAGYLRLFIILLVVALVFIIMAVLFNVLLGYLFWYIFMILGAIALIAALLILILGLTGLM